MGIRGHDAAVLQCAWDDPSTPRPRWARSKKPQGRAVCLLQGGEVHAQLMAQSLIATLLLISINNIAFPCIGMRALFTSYT